MLERRPCLFGSASAAGILFWASPKGALDLIASRPRSASLRSARSASLRSRPYPGKVPVTCPLADAGAGPRPPPPRPLSRAQRKKKNVRYI